MADPTPPPQRVRVTSPRTTARSHPRRTTLQEIDEETSIGEVYMRSLMRSQLRLAVEVVVVLAATVGALPLVFAVFPEINGFAVAGIPLPWILLGFVVYPVLFLLGWIYIRQSERTESDFAELVERT